MTNCRAALVALIAMVPALGQDWFGAPRLFMHTDPIRVVTDVDADGDLDLVRVTPGAGGAAVSFTVMVNAGNAEFADAPPVMLAAGVGLAVAAGDVTGDGRPDLVIATTLSYAAGSGFLVFPGSPSGAFGAPTHQSITGFVVRTLHLADVTGDGVLDVGVWLADAVQGQFNWHPALGGGAFSTWPGVTFPLGQLSPTRASLVVDTNGDGIPDVAIAGTTGMIFCPTIGSASVVGPTHAIATTATQETFAAGDLDGDGDADILYAGGTPNPPFTNMLVNLVRIVNQGGGVWAAPVQQTYAGQGYWGGGRLSIGHWDGDGYPDVVMTTAKPFGNTESQIRIFAASASGSFSLAIQLFGWEPDPAGPGIFDVSGDGIPDFVGGFEIVFGVGGMTNPFGRLAGAVEPARARDWDGDGDLDFETTSGIGTYHANDGRGVFAPILLTLPPPPGGLILGPNSLQGDFNGDQRPEWLVGVVTPPAPPFNPFGSFNHHRIYSDAGNGTLVDLGVTWPTPVPSAGDGRAIVVDVDGDGFEDVVAYGGVWYSNGIGLLSPGPPSYPNNFPVAVGDVDGDADPDIVVMNWSFPTCTVTVLVNIGGGVWGYMPMDTGSSALADGRLADLDDDGDVDVLLAYGTVTVNTGSVVHVLENLGNLGVVAHQLTFPTLGSQFVMAAVDAGDVDGDGMTDLVLGFAPPFLGPPSVTGFAVLRRVGPGLNFETPRTWSTPLFARLADLDGDGDLDASGPSFLFNRKFHGTAAGSSRQFGAPSPGTNGILPILGRSGPARLGELMTIRVRRGLGGAYGVLAVGAAQSNVTYPGLPGIVSYAEPWLVILPVLLGGQGGQPGGGFLDLSVIVPASLTGTALYLQAGFADPGAPAATAVTQGLEIRFGL